MPIKISGISKTKQQTKLSKNAARLQFFTIKKIRDLKKSVTRYFHSIKYSDSSTYTYLIWPDIFNYSS